MSLLKKSLLMALVLLVPLIVAACNGTPTPGAETPDDFESVPGTTPVETPDATIEPSTPEPSTPVPSTPSPTPMTTPESPAATPTMPDATPTPLSAGRVNMVTLSDVEGSGQTGVALFRGQQGSTEIAVGVLSALLGGQEQGDMEASVLTGSCDAPESVAYEVGPVAGGIAIGNIAEPVDALLEQDLAVAVHEAGDEQALIACGNIADSTEVDAGTQITLPVPGGGS